MTYLPLARLSQPQAQQMVRQMSRERNLPPELLRQIVTKTDGIPIFVEELTRMVLELLAEAGPSQSTLPALAIPATLHDSLMARLDRLAYGRETIQLAATLGREFNYSLLQALSPLDEATLQRDLNYLVEAGLIAGQDTPPQARYTFKHALIQETAYRSLLRRKRQQLHRQITEVLLDRLPELVQTEPEVLAHHYTAAGLYLQAIEYWQRAGQRAMARSANLEAANHFKKGLELLEKLPESPQRFHLELELQMAVGAPLLMTQGYAAPAVEPHYARAKELSRQLGELPHLSPALFGLWVFYLVRADYTPAQELGQQLMRLAEQAQEPILMLQAHQVQGINSFYQGELEAARRHLEQAVTLYDPWQHEAHMAIYAGADPGVASLAHLALTLWLLGYPEQAIERSQAAITLAKGLAHPYSLTFALALATWLRQYNRQAGLALELGETAMSLAAEQDFTLLGAMATILAGWARTEQGEVEAGITQIFQGLAGFRATGAALGQPHFLALLADAHRKAGQIEEGLAVITGALAAVQARGERFYEAELYRLKGELLGQTPAGAEAEQAFLHALKVARQQEAHSLALRAATSLGRLWQRQGRETEARAALRDIYQAFSEGFEFMDWQEARLLLSD
jgi:predicted ATPase